MKKFEYRSIDFIYYMGSNEPTEVELRRPEAGHETQPLEKLHHVLARLGGAGWQVLTLRIPETAGHYQYGAHISVFMMREIPETLR
jgi:hypothetical protein